MRTGKRALVTWSALIAALFLCVTLVAFPMCLVWIALGVYFCYQGWKAKKDG